MSYSFGRYGPINSGYRWATDISELGMADRASDEGDEGDNRMQSVIGPVVALDNFMLPKGKAFLIHAIQRFYETREGRPAVAVPVPEIGEIASPVRTALVDGHIPVECFAHDGSRLSVEPSVFGDWSTWYAAFADPATLPTRPEGGLRPGYLVIDQADFDRVMFGELPPNSADSAFDRYIPPIIAYALELAERFDLSPNYRFNRGRMADHIIKLAADEEPGLKIGVEKASYLSTFLGHPVFNTKISDDDPVVVGISSISLARERDVNVGRSSDPGLSFNGISYPRPRKRVKGELGS